MAKRKRVKKVPVENKPAEVVDFEEAMKQLESIVEDLEGGELGLNDSLDRYEEGVKHLKQCFALLSKAEKRIALLTGVDADGNPIADPYEDDHDDLDDKAASRSKRRTASKTPNSANKSRRKVVDDSSSLF